MTTQQPTIIYTLTDEAPLLATCAFLPIVRTFAAPAGIKRRHERHLGGRPHPGRVPRVPDRRAAGARQPGRAGQADAAARRQHHQAAQHQRLGGPAGRPRSRSCRPRATRFPDYPGEPEDRRREGDPRALRQVHGQRREPGAARRQLRPPRAAGGEGLRPQEPAQHGRVEPGLAHARLAHARTATSTTARSR